MEIWKVASDTGRIQARPIPASIALAPSAPPLPEASISQAFPTVPHLQGALEKAKIGVGGPTLAKSIFFFYMGSLLKIQESPHEKKIRIIDRIRCHCLAPAPFDWKNGFIAESDQKTLSSDRPENHCERLAADGSGKILTSWRVPSRAEKEDLFSVPT